MMQREISLECDVDVSEIEDALQDRASEDRASGEWAVAGSLAYPGTLTALDRYDQFVRALDEKAARKRESKSEDRAVADAARHWLKHEQPAMLREFCNNPTCPIWKMPPHFPGRLEQPKGAGRKREYHTPQCENSAGERLRRYAKWVKLQQALLDTILRNRSEGLEDIDTLYKYAMQANAIRKQMGSGNATGIVAIRNALQRPLSVRPGYAGKRRPRPKGPREIDLIRSVVSADVRIRLDRDRSAGVGFGTLVTDILDNLGGWTDAHEAALTRLGGYRNQREEHSHRFEVDDCE